MRIFRLSLFAWLIFSVFCLALLCVPGVIDAQEEVTETPTSKPSITPTPTPTSILLSIFRDTDTFTLYAPAQGEISLVGFTFAVSDKIYALENFGAFRGLPFGRLPTPICFRLMRSGANSPLPLDCASAIILPQTLANADVFWYDSVKGNDLNITIQGAIPLFCVSGQSRCDIAFTPSDATSTPTASVTETPTATSVDVLTTATPTTPPPISPVKQYPCDGTIVVSTSPGVGLNKVHVIARRSSPNRSPVSQGSTVTVLGTQRVNGITWYQISYNNNQGWIEAEYITLSSACPL